MAITVQLDSEIAKDFPEAQIRFITAHGLDNSVPWPKAEELLGRLESDVTAGTWHPLTKEDPAVRSWHDAYRKFGTNPNRNRPSVDALSRRLGRDHKLPRINSAVNAYNYISVVFGTPAGAFDLGQLDGPVVIRYAQLGDVFSPLGARDAPEEPTVGEVVYAERSCVLTRHWNYRDADQTKVTERSHDVVFIIERISREAVPDSRIMQAQQTLADLVKLHATSVELSMIEPETPMTELIIGEPRLTM